MEEKGRVPEENASFCFDDSVSLLEDEDWCRRHVTRDFSGTRVDHHFYLLPYRRFKGKLRLTLKKRGIFDLGQYYLQVGDLPLDLRVVHQFRMIADFKERIVRFHVANVRPFRRLLEDAVPDMAVLVCDADLLCLRDDVPEPHSVCHS